MKLLDESFSTYEVHVWSIEILVGKREETCPFELTLYRHED